MLWLIKFGSSKPVPVTEMPYWTNAGSERPLDIYWFSYSLDSYGGVNTLVF